MNKCHFCCNLLVCTCIAGIRQSPKSGSSHLLPCTSMFQRFTVICCDGRVSPEISLLHICLPYTHLHTCQWSNVLTTHTDGSDIHGFLGNHSPVYKKCTTCTSCETKNSSEPRRLRQVELLLLPHVNSVAGTRML